MKTSKVIRRMLSVVLILALVFPMFDTLSHKAHASEKPNHIVLLRFDGLGEPDAIFQSSKLASEHRIEDNGILHISSLEIWARPFLEGQNNTLGLWQHPPFGTDEMIDGGVLKFWSDWDDMQEQWKTVYKKEPSCVLSSSGIDGAYLVDYDYVCGRVINNPSDIVTIVNIGDFEQKGYIEQKSKDDPFLHEASAKPYQLSDEYLQSVIDAIINTSDYDSVKNRPREEHYEGLVNQERYAWTSMQKTKNSMPSNMNLISVNVNDGLDSFRTEEDEFEKILGRQYMKDTQNAGYYEIHYDNVAEFLTQLLPAINSTSSSNELRQFLGSQSSFAKNYIPAIPIDKTVEYKNHSLKFTFNEQYFSSGPKTYNHEMAKMSMGLCASSYGGDDSIKGCYNDLGFTNYRLYSLDENFFKDDTTKSHIATKTLKDGTELVSITLCGTQGNLLLGIFGLQENEWSHYYEYFSDLNGLTFDDNGEFENFLLAQINLQAMLHDYCEGDFKGKKFHITGHSRGAAVGALEADVLNDIIGEENVYCYTFATPNTHLRKAKSVDVAENVFNVVDAMDIVPQLPPLGSKIGQTYGYNTTIGDATGKIRSLSPDPLVSMANGLIHHTPENYMLLVGAMEPQKQFNYQKWRWVKIHCETDLVVKDKEGNVVASITNNVPDEENQYLITTNKDGNKGILLPVGEEYTVFAVGTNDGTMTYSVDTLEDSEFTSEIDPYEISFKKGDVFIAKFNEDDLDDAQLTKANIIKKVSFRSNIPERYIHIALGIIAMLIVVAVLILLSRRNHKRISKKKK